jgi:hypothetical protein
MDVSHFSPKRLVLTKFFRFGFLHAECVTHLNHLFVPQVLGVAKVSVAGYAQITIATRNDTLIPAQLSQVKILLVDIFN